MASRRFVNQKISEWNYTYKPRVRPSDEHHEVNNSVDSYDSDYWHDPQYDAYNYGPDPEEDNRQHGQRNRGRSEDDMYQNPNRRNRDQADFKYVDRVWRRLSQDSPGEGDPADDSFRRHLHSDTDHQPYTRTWDTRKQQSDRRGWGVRRSWPYEGQRRVERGHQSESWDERGGPSYESSGRSGETRPHPGRWRDRSHSSEEKDESSSDRCENRRSQPRDDFERSGQRQKRGQDSEDPSEKWRERADYGPWRGHRDWNQTSSGDRGWNSHDRQRIWTDRRKETKSRERSRLGGPHSPRSFLSEDRLSVSDESADESDERYDKKRTDRTSVEEVTKQRCTRKAETGSLEQALSHRTEKVFSEDKGIGSGDEKQTEYYNSPYKDTSCWSGPDKDQQEAEASDMSVCSMDSQAEDSPFEMTEEEFKEEMFCRLNKELGLNMNTKEREAHIAQHIREMAKLSPTLFRKFMANNAEHLAKLAAMQASNKQGKDDSIKSGEQEKECDRPEVKGQCSIPVHVHASRRAQWKNTPVSTDVEQLSTLVHVDEEEGNEEQDGDDPSLHSEFPGHHPPSENGPFENRPHFDCEQPFHNQPFENRPPAENLPSFRNPPPFEDIPPFNQAPPYPPQFLIPPPFMHPPPVVLPPHFAAGPQFVTVAPPLMYLDMQPMASTHPPLHPTPTCASQSPAAFLVNEVPQNDILRRARENKWMPQTSPPPPTLSQKEKMLKAKAENSSQSQDCSKNLPGTSKRQAESTVSSKRAKRPREYSTDEHQSEGDKSDGESALADRMSQEAKTPDVKKSQLNTTASKQMTVKSTQKAETIQSCKTSAESSKTSTESGKTSAESSKMSTESIKTSAESSKTSTESGKTSADSSKTSTESCKTSAESSKMSTESIKTSAESSKTSTESGKTSADSSKTSTESCKTSAESSKMSTESCKTSADSCKTSRESGKTSADISKTSRESGKISADSSKTSRENGKTSADNSKTSTESGKTSADNSKTSTESGKTSADSSKTSTESGKTSYESSKTSTESGKTSADSSKTSTESGKISYESSKMSTESGKTSAESSETLRESGKTSAESSETLTESGKTSAESSEMLTESGKTSAESSEMLTESGKTSAESSKMSTESGKTSAESSKMSTESGKTEEELIQRARKLVELQQELDVLSKHREWLEKKLEKGTDHQAIMGPLLIRNRQQQHEISEEMEALREGKITTSMTTDTRTPASDEKKRKEEERDKNGDVTNTRLTNWCRVCNLLCHTLQDFLDHLASHTHLQNQRPSSHMWQKEALSNYRSSRSSPSPPVKGAELLVSTVALYCPLCHKLCADTKVAEAHLKSEQHYNRYKAYMSKYPMYEERYQQDCLARRWILDSRKQPATSVTDKSDWKGCQSGSRGRDYFERRERRSGSYGCRYSTEVSHSDARNGSSRQREEGVKRKRSPSPGRSMSPRRKRVSPVDVIDLTEEDAVTTSSSPIPPSVSNPGPEVTQPTNKASENLPVSTQSISDIVPELMESYSESKPWSACVSSSSDPTEGIAVDVHSQTTPVSSSKHPHSMHKSASALSQIKLESVQNTQKSSNLSNKQVPKRSVAPMSGTPSEISVRASAQSMSKPKNASKQMVTTTNAPSTPSPSSSLVASESTPTVTAVVSNEKATSTIAAKQVAKVATAAFDHNRKPNPTLAICKPRTPVISKPKAVPTTVSPKPKASPTSPTSNQTPIVTAAASKETLISTTATSKPVITSQTPATSDMTLLAATYEPRATFATAVTEPNATAASKPKTTAAASKPKATATVSKPQSTGTSTSNQTPRVTKGTPTSNQTPRVITGTPMSDQTPRVTRCTPTSDQTHGVTTGTSISNQTPRVTTDTPTSNQKSRVTTGTPTSNQTPRVTTGTPISNQTPRVIRGTPTSNQTLRMTTGTPTPNQIPRVTVVTPTCDQTPRVTVGAPASNQTPRVAAGTPTPNQTPSAGTPTSNQTPRVAAGTSISNQTPRAAADTPTSNQTPRMTAAVGKNTPTTLVSKSTPKITTTAAKPKPTATNTPSKQITKIASAAKVCVASKPTCVTSKLTVKVEPTRKVAAAPSEETASRSSAKVTLTATKATAPNAKKTCMPTTQSVKEKHTHTRATASSVMGTPTPSKGSCKQITTSEQSVTLKTASRKPELTSNAAQSEKTPIATHADSKQLRMRTATDLKQTSSSVALLDISFIQETDKTATSSALLTEKGGVASVKESKNVKTSGVADSPIRESPMVCDPASSSNFGAKRLEAVAKTEPETCTTSVTVSAQSTESQQLTVRRQPSATKKLSQTSQPATVSVEAGLSAVTSCQLEMPVTRNLRRQTRSSAHNKDGDGNSAAAYEQNPQVSAPMVATDSEMQEKHAPVISDRVSQPKSSSPQEDSTEAETGTNNSSTKPALGVKRTSSRRTPKGHVLLSSEEGTESSTGAETSTDKTCTSTAATKPASPVKKTPALRRSLRTQTRSGTRADQTVKDMDLT